jgi:cytidyltransferase-like protein
MTNSHTVGYMVGRFNPLQKGHLALLQHVHDDNDHLVVLVGSATESRTHKNPLTYEERKSLILKNFPQAVLLPMPDMPSDDDWVKMFESTIAMGIQSLRLAGDVKARLYSADATRADDYALRCEWVRNLGHEVVPFVPVRASTDLSASLVRDKWFNGLYEEMRELVPPDTFELMQQLNIGWMRSPYVKKVELGELAERNSVFVAFISKGDRHSPLYVPNREQAEQGVRAWDGYAAAKLGYVVRATGDLGFVGGMVDDGETLTQALLREVKEEIGVSLDPARLVPAFTHSMTGQGKPQNTHLFVCEVTKEEIAEFRRSAVDARHALYEVSAFAVTYILPGTSDMLLQQKWAGTAVDELRALLWSGMLPAAELVDTRVAEEG